MARFRAFGAGVERPLSFESELCSYCHFDVTYTPPVLAPARVIQSSTDNVLQNGMAVGQKDLIPLGRPRISQALADYAIEHDRRIRSEKFEMF